MKKKAIVPHKSIRTGYLKNCLVELPTFSFIRKVGRYPSPNQLQQLRSSSLQKRRLQTSGNFPAPCGPRILSRPSLYLCCRLLRNAAFYTAAIVFPLVSCAGSGSDEQLSTGLKFEITLPLEVEEDPLDGRMILLFGTHERDEPRFQFGRGTGDTQGFGIDLENWDPSTPAVIDGSVFGYPAQGLADVPAGTYQVQAVFNRYHTYNRADGHSVKLPPDQGEGQVWSRKPGNFYSRPEEIEVDPSRQELIEISLDHVIPELPPFEDLESDYIRYFRIRSDRLSEFWGEDVYLAAWVLLPKGFENNPDVRYPLAIWHGHFPSNFSGWQEVPPDPEKDCVYSSRFRLDCYNLIEAEESWRLYQIWTGPNFLRHLVIQIQHPTPYYDDSYAVNSANNGPYGDAITYELIPAIEAEFRGIGEAWARFLYGGSTGGWASLAAQVLYPDDYNGAWASCPDPISFEEFTAVNLYEDYNAYRMPSHFKSTRRTGFRDHRGLTVATLEEINHQEAVLGSRSRSGDQWDIWQATYSPVGEEGYPMSIWHKMTGEIDPQVAVHWRENYDLVHILRRDWESGLGERLVGKLHIYTGTMDNYYLENAVYLAENFLEKTENPYYEGEVAYGYGKEHCWNGHPTLPNAVSRLRYIEMHAPKILERIRTSAPDDADIDSFLY